MPQKDDKGRYCGVVDVEEKEKSAKFIRRYLRLDKRNGVVEWFTDNPSTLPPASQPQGTIDINFITKVDIPVKLKFKAKNCFFIHTPPRRYYFQGINDKDMREWVDILDNASKIVVPPDDDTINSDVTNSADQSTPKNFTQTEGFGYTTEVVAGVIIQKKMPTAEEHPNGNDESKVLRTLSLPHGGSPKRYSVMTGKVLKKGWAVKQGHVRKNWKRRYFVITTCGFSYFHTDQDTEPIRSIPVSAILTAKQDHSSMSENRANLLLVATMERKYYIQADNREEMNDWINSFCDAMGHSSPVRRRSKEVHSRMPAEPHPGASGTPRKLDVSLSHAPQAQRNSSYLGSTNSPNTPGSRLSFADETFYTRPTSIAETNRNQHATRHLRTASSSEDSSGLGGSVDSLSGPGLDTKPLIKKKSPKQHFSCSPKNYKGYQRSSSGNDILPPNAPATTLTSMLDKEKLSTAGESPKTSTAGSISASNASSPRSSGSFSSLQSPRTSKLLQLDPKVDLRAAVKPSTVKRKKNTGILFSLNNVLNKKAEKISSPKEEVKLI